MNKIIILIFFQLLTETLFCQTEATKQETVEWIKSRLDYYQSYSEKEYYEIKVIKYDYKNDTLYYKCHVAEDGNPHKSYWIYSIPIKDINPDRIKPVRLIGDTGVGIEIYTNYGKESILNSTYSYPSRNFLRTSSNKFLTMEIPMSVFKREGKEEFVYRIIKAFRHLVILSGSKGEKF